MVIVIAMKSFCIALVGGAIVALGAAFDERTARGPSPKANADGKGVKRGGGDGWEASDRWGAPKRLKAWNVPSDGDAYASKQDSGNDNFRKFGKFGKFGVDQNKNVENFGYWGGPRPRFGGMGGKNVPRSQDTFGRQGIFWGEGDPDYTPEKMAADLERGAKAKGNGIFVPPELARRFKGRGGNPSEDGNVGGRV